MTTDTQTVTATLIRGRYHDAAGQVWNRDVPATLTQPVTPETEAYLRENAVDIEHHHGHEYRYPRFTYSNDAPRAAPTERPARRRLAAGG